MNRISRSPDLCLQSPGYLMKFAICCSLDFLARKSEIFSVVSGTVEFTLPPPPPPTEPVNLALMRRLCKAVCYCRPGKSFSPYLKTCEVDSPGTPLEQFLLCFSILLYFVCEQIFASKGSANQSILQFPHCLKLTKTTDTSHVFINSLY